MKLSNKQFDIIKWVAIYLVPATATFILTVGKIWNLPYYDNIAATVTAFGVFLGAIIGVSTASYNKNVEQMKREDLDENQLMMAESMLEEDEQELLKEE